LEEIIEISKQGDLEQVNGEAVSLVNLKNEDQKREFAKDE
jgi:hypothetical protein